jgi:hypothetical protein
VNTWPPEEPEEESPWKSVAVFDLNKNLSLLDRKLGNSWQGLNRADNWEGLIKK